MKLSRLIVDIQIMNLLEALVAAQKEQAHEVEEKKLREEKELQPVTKPSDEMLLTEELSLEESTVEKHDEVDLKVPLEECDDDNFEDSFDANIMELVLFVVEIEDSLLGIIPCCVPTLNYDSRMNRFEEEVFNTNHRTMISIMQVSPLVSIFLCNLKGSKGKIHDLKAMKFFICFNHASIWSSRIKSRV